MDNILENLSKIIIMKNINFQLCHEKHTTTIYFSKSTNFGTHFKIHFKNPMDYY